MKIAIDMQGAQTESRFRGIGKYTIGFVEALLRNRGDHEILIVLNGMLEDSIPPILDLLDKLMPRENIYIWSAEAPVGDASIDNQSRPMEAEIIREVFFENLGVDFIHLTSLFEGYVEGGVTSISKNPNKTPVSMMLYDLIPLLNEDHYFTPNPQYKKYYLKKIESLINADLLFSISEFTREELLSNLDIDAQKVTNISTGVGSNYKPINISDAESASLTIKYSISSPFILYVGGCDPRKNLERLISAYAMLPTQLKQVHQLVFAGKFDENSIQKLRKLANGLAIPAERFVMTGYVPDVDLVKLYNLCSVFVFPSWHEGFGIPAAEAMACGAVVITSNTSSLPEVTGINDALFDPYNEQSICVKLQEALTNHEFRSIVASHGLQQAKNFSWDNVAKYAIQAWQAALNKPKGKILMSQNKMQILVDVSLIMELKFKSLAGIQRVVRSVLSAWLSIKSDDFTITPVFCDPNGLDYKYVDNFIELCNDNTLPALNSRDVVVSRGDIFFGLDLNWNVILQVEVLKEWQRNGVGIYFVVYDLLPILYPECFETVGYSVAQRKWMAVISQFDGIFCISKSVMSDVKNYLNFNLFDNNKNCKIDWFHLGVDLTYGLARASNQSVLADLRAFSGEFKFLMVGTIEPRKSHDLVLSSFDMLWSHNVDCALIIVGKVGWNTSDFISRLKTHPQLNKKLFWFDNLDDGDLTKVYNMCDCYIAASLNEGFGLPIIEAANHGLPVIARDIPVFREIGSDACYFFKKDELLGHCIYDWMNLFKSNEHPNQADFKWLTWKESSAILLEKLLEMHRKS